MPKPYSQARSVVTAIGLTYGSVIGGSIVVSVVVSLLTGLGINRVATPSGRLLASTVFLQGVTFGGLAVLYLRVRGLSFDFVPIDIPDRRDIVVIVAGTLVLLGLLLVASRIIAFLGIESAQNQVAIVGKQNPTVLLLLVPLSFLLIGPGEELLYRGLVQGTLAETLHPLRAIVIASALFASIHLFALSGDGKVVYIGIAFVLALILGWSYEYTDNLTVPAVIHGAYNAAQFASMYLSATGGF